LEDINYSISFVTNHLGDYTKKENERINKSRRTGDANPVEA
jgi:hypothetical protein